MTEDKGRANSDMILKCRGERTGLTVLRFSDREVFENIDSVMERIWSYL